MSRGSAQVIASFGRARLPELSEEWLDKMTAAAVSPNLVSYSTVIAAYRPLGVSVPPGTMSTRGGGVASATWGSHRLREPPVASSGMDVRLGFPLR